MSRGTSGWFPCATAVFLLHLLGLDSPHIRQLVFGISAALNWQSEDSSTSVLTIVVGYLHYVVVFSAVVQLAKSLLAWLNSPTQQQTQQYGPGQVMLFPCKTPHTRTFPKKHSFEYSYLVVGIPVGWEGVSGGLVSSSSAEPSWFSQPNRGWYHIDPADYLERGNRHLGLRGKLDAHLQSQGVDPTTYPHAYLVTAARFLGYHFNPVSFWYLYTSDMHLGAMILEVNNTFDERRMYFLTPAETAITDNTGADKSPVFKQEWPKDFHVSPFNSRKGSYSLLASDPFHALSKGRCPIDGTIVLKSSKGHGKIVARLYSDGDGLVPSSMTLCQKAQFLLSWWWVGFVTFPRIVKEAGRLWFKRKLHVWYRPEPLKQSMGRHADSAEKQLETSFRKYLRSLVHQSQASVAVKYIPSGIPDANTEVMLSPSATTRTDGTMSDGVEMTEFKVLTPAFYTRFVFYAHDLEALFSELRESCTIWVSRPEILPKILFKKPQAVLQARSPLDFVLFEAIRYLRRRPQQIVRPLISSQTLPTPAASASVKDIRDFRISSMDAFFMRQEDSTLRRRYRNLVLKLLLADRLAFGSLLLVDTVILLLQAWLAWTAVFSLQGRARVIGLASAILSLGYQ